MTRLRVRMELNRGGVGVPLHKLAHVVECLAHAKINGFNAKPVALPLGEGPGSAAFTGSANRVPERRS